MRELSSARLSGMPVTEFVPLAALAGLPARRLALGSRWSRAKSALASVPILPRKGGLAAFCAAAGARTAAVRAAARAPAALDVWRRGKDAPSIGAGKTTGNPRNCGSCPRLRLTVEPRSKRVNEPFRAVSKWPAFWPSLGPFAALFRAKIQIVTAGEHLNVGRPEAGSVNARGPQRSGSLGNPDPSTGGRRPERAPSGARHASRGRLCRSCRPCCAPAAAGSS